MTFIWPELYFIRHGQTDWNAKGRYQGSKDIPLNAVGREQADLNGKLLRQLFERGGRSPDAFSWHVSPLSRTTETMQRIRAAFDAPLPPAVPDKRLVEVSFGVYEGRLHSELSAEEMAIAGERDASFWTFRPPQGESYEDVAQRVLSFAAELRGPAVVVAHGGILRILRRLIEDFPAERTVNWFPPQDSVVHFIDGRSVVYPAGQSWDD